MTSFKTKCAALMLGIGLSSVISASSAAEESPWSFEAEATGSLGSYKKSVQRDRFSETGINVTADYEDVGGVVAGYTNARIKMKKFLPTVEQNDFLLSGHLNFKSATLPGQVTLRADYYAVNSNDSTGDTEDAKIYATQLSWLSDKKDRYADLGYAYSRYENNLTVKQFTPTIGFGWNNNTDWIQLRSYHISGLKPLREEGKSSTSSVEAKWTRYLTPTTPWCPNSFYLSASAGERTYAVDMDTQYVANQADINTGSVQLGASWELNKMTKLSALVGQGRYKDPAFNNAYKLVFGYAGLTFSW